MTHPDAADIPKAKPARGKAWRCRTCGQELGRIVEIRYPVNFVINGVMKAVKKRRVKLVPDNLAVRLEIYPEGRIHGLCTWCGSKAEYDLT